MKATPDTVERWQGDVVHFLQSKVKELRFHLRALVDACDASMNYSQLLLDKKVKLTETEQLEQQQKQVRYHEIVTYSFSAFSNTIQGLKDALKNGAGFELTWGAIREARHGKFIYEARNACTHDGNPIVNAWVDGKFYVGYDIIRVNDGKVINIQRPAEDIKTIVLEFSIDFLTKILNEIDSVVFEEDFKKSIVKPDEIMKFVNSNPLIPPEIKKLIKSNFSEIVRVSSTHKSNPIGDFKKEVKLTIDYLNEMDLLN